MWSIMNHFLGLVAGICLGWALCVLMALGGKKRNKPRPDSGPVVGNGLGNVMAEKRKRA
jgi:hypothetical protein